MLQLNYFAVAVFYPGLLTMDNGHFQLVLNLSFRSFVSCFFFFVLYNVIRWFKLTSLLYLKLICFLNEKKSFVTFTIYDFRYNHISLGLFLFSFVCFVSSFLKLGSVLFVLALNFKQMELYHSLPIAIYLISKSFPADNRLSLIQKFFFSLFFVNIKPIKESVRERFHFYVINKKKERLILYSADIFTG